MDDLTDLAEVRAEIAQNTKQIIELAGRRNQLAREAGEAKARDSLPPEDLGVEDELVRQVIASCDDHGVDRRAGLKILSVLLSESKRVQGVRVRPSIAPIFAKALELQQKGVKLVRLDVGEPDFRPPKAVLQACSDALFGMKTHYTDSRGIPELREALRGYLKKNSGFDPKDSEVTVTPSGRFAVYSSLASVVKEGESAVVIEPSWPAYKDALEELGARASIIPTSMEEKWNPKLEEIEESIRSNTRAIILSYPNNPTGKVVSPGLFREIVELADDHGLTVISDEIYNEYTNKPCPSILDSIPRKFILTSSFSKTWAMTGFRIGYAVADEETIASISRMISLMVTSVPEFIQWGAIAALESDSDVRGNVSEMRERTQAACKELDGIDALEYFEPDGAMYVFPKLKEHSPPGDAFSEKMLEKGVSVVPGSTFGKYPDFFRISLGQPKDVIVEGIRRMGEALS